MVGATEYLVHTTATATQDLPPAYTGCHAHGETFCIGPNGEEVEISLASEGAGHDDHDEHGDEHEDEVSSGGMNCHFHAGVEHCTGADGEEVAQTCERVDRDYNINLRVGLLFVMLATSSIGVFGPILLARFVSPRNVVLTILKQFGTGVVVSTAFIHLYTHAQLMFTNECLGKLSYESTASAILMAGIFLSFLVEYLGVRIVQWQKEKAAAGSVESAADQSLQVAKTDMVNITVLEAGVIFHSLLIGLTLVVAGDSFFLTLFAVIVFHQMFEGVALGTRIAALGQPCDNAPTPAHAHGHGHGHAHGHSDSHSHAHGENDNLEHIHNHMHSAATKNEHETSPAPQKSESGDESDTATALTLKNTSSQATAYFSMKKKLMLAAAFALVTPIGMAIGIGVLKNFNGNDPSTIIAIGTLDALSAGILVWVGCVEMWAHDWMLGGEMTNASPLRTFLGLTALVIGMAVMSLLGKWA